MWQNWALYFAWSSVRLGQEAVGLAEEGYTVYKMRLGTTGDGQGMTVDRFLNLVTYHRRRRRSHEVDVVGR